MVDHLLLEKVDLMQSRWDVANFWDEWDLLDHHWTVWLDFLILLGCKDLILVERSVDRSVLYGLLLGLLWDCCIYWDWRCCLSWTLWLKVVYRSDILFQSLFAAKTSQQLYFLQVFLDFDEQRVFLLRWLTQLIVFVWCLSALWIKV